MNKTIDDLTAQLHEAREYADRLAEGLPDGMLPKDVSLLREANLGLATELVAVTAQRDRLAKACDQYSEDEILCKLHVVTEQRDRLAEALQKLADCDWSITLPDRMDAVRTIATEALQSLTPKP